jgi:hypothetical protein
MQIGFMVTAEKLETGEHQRGGLFFKSFCQSFALSSSDDLMAWFRNGFVFVAHITSMAVIGFHSVQLIHRLSSR